MDEKADWFLVKTDGIAKWVLRIGSVAFSFSAFFLLLTGPEGQTGLVMAAVSGLAAAFLWYETSRLRNKWNEQRIENHSHHFPFRDFA